MKRPQRSRPVERLLARDRARRLGLRIIDGGRRPRSPEVLPIPMPRPVVVRTLDGRLLLLPDAA